VVDKNNVAEVNAEAIRRAQEEAKQRPPKIGDAVVHPDCEFSMEIKEISNDGMATCSYPDEDKGSPIEKKFPFSELVDAGRVAKHRSDIVNFV